MMLTERKFDIFVHHRDSVMLRCCTKARRKHFCLVNCRPYSMGSKDDESGSLLMVPQ